MNIESGNGLRCVSRAFSTMRLVLGYDGILPVDLGEGPSVKKTTRLVGKCFPNNQVLVWTSKDSVSKRLCTNVQYCGESFYPEEWDDTRYLQCFSYHPRESHSTGHMVIGAPVKYNDCIGVIILVKLHSKQT